MIRDTRNSFWTTNWEE